MAEAVSDRMKKAGGVSAELAKAIEILDVESGDGEASAGVFIRSRPRFAKPTESVLLRVVPANMAGRNDPVTAYLARKGPWTLEALPVEPSRAMAGLVAETVPDAIYARARARLANMRDSVRTELMAMGVRNFRDPSDQLVSPVIDDLNLLARRAEMGILSNVPAVWGPALRDVARNAGQFADLVLGPESALPPLEQASDSDVESARNFQTKVRP